MDSLAIHLESRIADIAQARNLPTVTAAARAAGLAPSTVRRLWPRKTPRWIKFSTVAKLCKALDAKPGELFVVVKNEQGTEAP